VTLSKTKKKPGLERKGRVVAEIKDAIDKYTTVYVFTYDNMRNQKLKDLRDQLKSTSRYCCHSQSSYFSSVAMYVHANVKCS
jgi:mRNA turnover protein 4